MIEVGFSSWAKGGNLEPWYSGPIGFRPFPFNRTMSPTGFEIDPKAASSSPANRMTDDNASTRA